MLSAAALRIFFSSVSILNFYFQHLTSLCAVATECVSSLAIDAILQMHLLQAGCLWHLLIFLFDYDYTLEEGGVEAEEENRYGKLFKFKISPLDGNCLKFKWFYTSLPQVAPPMKGV